MYYPRLAGPTGSAERLTITCPLNDWASLLAASKPSSESGATSLGVLSPCATASVSSGQELVSALERLQPGAARVFITLAANISLPADPTPQRADPAPGDDDDVPLVAVYRNVTLAGATAGAPNPVPGSSLDDRPLTEIDLRGRRNAFGLQAGWRLLQQRGEAAERLPSANATGPVWRGRPVLVVTDVLMVNMPAGAPATWPLGLLGILPWAAGLDRNVSAGVQLMSMRSSSVYPAEDLGYLFYWYSKMTSFSSEERASAAWYQRIGDSLLTVRDADGWPAVFSRVEGSCIAYNSSSNVSPLVTRPTPYDFNLWSSTPAGLLSAVQGPSVAAVSPLPPSSFAVAAHATELLALLQEPWTAGPRIILLRQNITLRGVGWPQGGARLSYNVTLAGPVAGPPVQLDTAGLQFAASVGRSTAVLFQRLHLVGLVPPLITASRADVAAARAAMGGATSQLPALQAWQDRCTAFNEAAAGRTPMNATASGTVQLEVSNCTLVLPEDFLQLLLRYNVAEACLQDDPATTATATALACSALRTPSLPAALTALLNQSLAVRGQANFSGHGATGSSLRLTLSFGTLGGLTFVNSQVVAGLSLTAEADPACGVKALLMALQPLLEAAAPSRPNPRTVAAAVGAAIAAALCALGAAALVWRRRHACFVPWRRLASKAAPGEGSKPHAEVTLVVEGGVGSAPGGLGGVLPAAVCAQEGTGSGPGGMCADSFSQSTAIPAALMADAAQLRTQGVIAPKAAGGSSRGARKGAVSAHRLRPMEFRASSLTRARSVEASTAGGSTASMRSAMADEIEAMLRRCQAVVIPSEGSSKPRRLQLLGRGAYGSVYLGEWRGLPAAIKIVLLGPGDAASRRERLAQEVALTLTLNHPHIVPTYDFELSAVRADDTGPASRPLSTYTGPTGPDWQAVPEDDEEVAALRLKLVMQYCDGGTLRRALEAGVFGAPPTPSSTPPPPRRVVRAWRPEVQGAALSPPASAERVSCASPFINAPTASASRANTEQAGATLLRTGGGASTVDSPVLPERRLAWEDLAPVQSMTIALLAALDILRGLEYLHASGIVHGDLTENNVLLKSAQPELPKEPTQPQSQAQSRTPSESQALLHLQSAPSQRSATALGPLRPATLGAGANLAAAPAGGAVPASAATVAAGALTSSGGSVQQPSQLWIAPMWVAMPDAPVVKGAHAARSPYQSALPAVHSPGNCEVSPGHAGSLPGSGPLLSIAVEVTLANNALAADPGVAGVTGHTHAAQCAPARAEGPAADAGVAMTALARGQTSFPQSLSVSASDHALPQLMSGVSDWALLHTSDVARGSSMGPFHAPPTGAKGISSGPGGSSLGVEGFESVVAAAAKHLGFVFKIADFGLSVQISGASQTHLSNAPQGTPFFAAPEVMQLGRLSPAADIYSFGVLLWLLLHNTSLGRVRHLLPRIPFAPIAPPLLHHASRALPPGCMRLLVRCLALEPAQRPSATELRRMVEEQLQIIAGPELARLLLTTERREQITAPSRQ